jgi:hypothetical protein
MVNELSTKPELPVTNPKRSAIIIIIPIPIAEFIKLFGMIPLAKSST